METIEQFAARQNAERAEFERKQAVGNALPLPPYLVVMQGKRAPTIVYRVAGLIDAIKIFKVFNIEPMLMRKGTFTSVQPESEFRANEEKYQSEDGPYACFIRTSQIVANNNSISAELHFYAQISTGLVNVHIQVGRGYIGACTGLGASINVHRTRSDRIESRTYAANKNASSLADRTIKWGSYEHGPVKTSGEFSYLFVADQMVLLPGIEQTHAIWQLINLADLENV